MKKYRHILCLLLSLVVLFTAVLPVRAVTVSELQKNVKDKQQKLNEQNKAISGLESEAEIIQQEINDLDDEILNLMTDIAILEDQIEVKKEEIAVAQAEYDEAKANEEAQYEAMKIRIQYMYEMGDSNYVSLLIEAQSMADLLNKAEYVEQIYAYDRKMLAEYQAITKKVEELKNKLEEEKNELEDQKAILSDQKAALDVLIEEKKKQASDYAAQIAEARKKAQALKNDIAEDQKKISAMQDEERKKLAANLAGSGNVSATTATIITNATGSELGKQIATYACQFVGNPYVHGGTSLTNGADCSGFTYRVYADFGYAIPRSSSAQTTCGYAVDYANAQPGDIICMSGHVGIYIGNGQMVHASTPQGGIKIGTTTFKPVIAVRRIVQ